MGTIKKPAAKKPAAKAASAKKPAVKKPAAKTASVKKPAAKAAAAKKPAASAKKPAAKTASAKKPAAKAASAKKPATKVAAKKPAAKTAVKKPATKVASAKTAVKKPAVKKPAAVKPTAAKPATVAKKPAAVKPAPVKPAAVKPAAVKPAAVKPAAAKPATTLNLAATPKPAPAPKPAAAKPAPVKPAAKPAAENNSAEVPDPNVKYRNLFEAFALGKLPFAHGYIISSFFSEVSAYSIYEVVSYSGVKEIFPTENGLQFVTGGKKLYILVEHDTYHNKPVEPVHRTQGESIPKRYNELDIITAASNQTKIMVAKEPNELYGSFTILKPQSINFSVIFYELPDVYKSIAAFFENSLNRYRKVPQGDAKKASQLIAATLEKTMGFKGEFA